MNSVKLILIAIVVFLLSCSAESSDEKIYYAIDFRI
jgi:hypothetical protein